MGMSMKVLKMIADMGSTPIASTKLTGASRFRRDQMEILETSSRRLLRSVSSGIHVLSVRYPELYVSLITAQTKNAKNIVLAMRSKVIDRTPVGDFAMAA